MPGSFNLARGMGYKSNNGWWMTNDTWKVTGYCLNMTGLVLYVTGYVLNKNVSVRNIIEFVINMTGFNKHFFLS